MGICQSTPILNHGPQPVTLESLSNNNTNTSYLITDYKWNQHSKGLTYLMKLVLLTNKNPELVYDIEDVVNDNPAELHKKNRIGWTPLMLAVANTTTMSSIETVKKLLELGANPNSTSYKKLSPLMVAVYNYGYGSDLETIKLLCSLQNIRINQYHYKYINNTVIVENALTYAVNGLKKDIKVIDYLIKNGAVVLNNDDVKVLIVQNMCIIDHMVGKPKIK
ncbi:MAG: hypothetical protein Homavirus1_26 [Homavirus sp.]|uniref:Uncharacterized protein n=1 Tax=Homavirus sp. TaxID=2487769 RepID=A0A3G5A437_9VIRU|nr:MAG: hypothetical protein Homavirus1_26 [Homavirus sp.]